MGKRGKLSGRLAVALGAALVVSGAASPALAETAETGPIGQPEYVAMGDSYSAGFGLTPFSATEPFTATPSTDLNGCYQAELNWPHLVAQRFHLALDDQTCSGAVTANLWSTPQYTMTEQTAPQVQLDALTASTKLVTITIGGNDLLFSQMAEYCLRETDGPDSTTWLPWGLSGRPYNCVDGYGAGESNDAYKLLDGTVKPALANAFGAVKQRLADLGATAKVLVVGYPQIAPTAAQNADGCFSVPWYQDGDGDWVYPENSVPYSATDTHFLADIEEQLVGAIHEAATAHGFSFVDAYTASAGHTLCDPEPYVWGLTFFQTATYHGCPPETSQLVYTYYCLELGALHPNDAGIAFMAEQVEQAIAPPRAEPPSLAASGELKAGQQATITGSGFEPFQTGIELWLRSDPVLLATAAADADGAFSALVTIPAATPAGSHSLAAVIGGADLAAAAVVVSLPDTGSEPLLPFALGLALIAGGALLLAIRRPAAGRDRTLVR